MIRVIVVDDHPVVREGVKQILSTTGMVVTGEARDGVEAMAVIRKQPCDVVLLDISMPKKSGLEVLKDLRGEFPRLPVLILGMDPQDHSALQSLRAGAAGYVTKDRAAANLVQAIREVRNGGKYISPALADMVTHNPGKGAQLPVHSRLSCREYQVFCMIGSGKTTVEIAAELGLSSKTISTYRVRLLDKLRMRNNAEITHYAIKEGLVE